MQKKRLILRYRVTKDENKRGLRNGKKRRNRPFFFIQICLLGSIRLNRFWGCAIIGVARQFPFIEGAEPRREIVAKGRQSPKRSARAIIGVARQFPFTEGAEPRREIVAKGRDHETYKGGILQMETERNPLLTVSPESVGLDSSVILAYLQKLEAEGHCLHGFSILRHGKIAAEGYYAPQQPQWKHRMYSTSKSFVSVAIGMLQDEGKITIQDKIASYFPEKLPEHLHPYIADASIRDLLMMSTPFQDSTYTVSLNPENDWIRSFFECEPSHRAGQIFSYDTSATTVLTALVEKLSGMELLDYLRSKGFDEMGFSREAICVKTPDGKVSWAGSGILCTLHDLNKFALLCLNMGNYNGKQLVSEEYMREATSKQIENGEHGYGYQFWCTPHGFACRGMGGQMVFYMPEQDMAFVTIGDMQGQPGYIQRMEDLFYDMVLPSVVEERPENPEAYQALTEYCAQLKIQTVKGAAESPYANKVSGKLYHMRENGAGAIMSLQLKTLRVDFEGDEGMLSWEDAEGLKTLRFGFGHHVHQNFPGFSPKEETEGKPVIVYGFNGIKVPLYLPCIVSGAWKSDHELEILCYSIGYFVGTLKIRLSFDENTVTARMEPFAEHFWEELKGFQTGEY